MLAVSMVGMAIIVTMGFGLIAYLHQEDVKDKEREERKKLGWD